MTPEDKEIRHRTRVLAALVIVLAVAAFAFGIAMLGWYLSN